MAKVVQFEINHFRKFEEFKCTFGMTNLVCLIGRGDSGKSSVLDALAYVLSPSRLLQLSDYDFTGCNTNVPIRIRAIVVDFDKNLLRADKYGYYQCAWDPKTNQLGNIEQDGMIPGLIVELIVDSALEPRWEVENPISGERKPIGFKDRALLNVSLISDYLNKHFAWANGSPLAALTHEAGEGLDQGVLQEISRSVREAADRMSFGNLDDILTSVANTAGKFGVNTGALKPAFDIKQMSIRDGAVCLHDEQKLPLRLRGNGSKRLLSVAIQASVSGDDGVTLIDEVEQGLEPDRVRSFVHTLARKTKGQVFLTTHSQNVLVEVNAENVFWLKGGMNAPLCVPSSYQWLLRSLPGAFFGKKIVLCEGKTELGLCKAFDEFLSDRERLNFSRSGIVLVIGRGDNFKKYAEAFVALGVRVMLFCDSDNAAQNQWKGELAERGVLIVSWANGDSVEDGVVKDLTDEALASLLSRTAQLVNPDVRYEEAEQEICNAVRRQGIEVDVDGLFRCGSYSVAMRKSIASAARDGKWYKSEYAGAVLGSVVCEYCSKLRGDCQVIGNLAALNEWITNA